MSGKILIVGQSGGPTAVINSSLYGVVSEARRHPEAISHVYGMVNGIEGFLMIRSSISTRFCQETNLTPFYIRRALIWAPAAISFRNLWMIRFTRSFLRSSKK